MPLWSALCQVQQTFAGIVHSLLPSIPLLCSLFNGKVPEARSCRCAANKPTDRPVARVSASVLEWSFVRPPGAKGTTTFQNTSHEHPTFCSAQRAHALAQVHRYHRDGASTKTSFVRGRGAKECTHGKPSDESVPAFLQHHSRASHTHTCEAYFEKPLQSKPAFLTASNAPHFCGWWGSRHHGRISSTVFGAIGRIAIFDFFPLSTTLCVVLFISLSLSLSYSFQMFSECFGTTSHHACPR